MSAGKPFDRAAFDADGYVLVPGVVTGPALDALAAITADITGSKSRRGGLRDPFEAIGGLLEVVRESELGALLAEILGPNAFAVRAILFDKRPGTNWSVAWHRDETIAVAERVDVPGFGPWSVKSGVDHVRPPRAVLDGMATLRLHLDDTPESNGPLRVIPGSHRQAGTEPFDESSAQSVPADAGGVLVMRPALVHSSGKQVHAGRRRVLHIECASVHLPEPLRWHRRVTL